jgi:hypothetical protein
VSSCLRRSQIRRPGPRGWVLDMGLTAPPCKNPAVRKSEVESLWVIKGWHAIDDGDDDDGMSTIESALINNITVYFKMLPRLHRLSSANG